MRPPAKDAAPGQGRGPRGGPRPGGSETPFAVPSGVPELPRRPGPRGAPRPAGVRTAHSHRARRGRSDARLPRRSLLPSPSGPKMLNPCANLKPSPHAAVNCCPAHDTFHIPVQCLCTSPGGGDLQAWMCDSGVPPHGKLFLMLIPGCIQVLMTNSPASSDINPWKSECQEPGYGAMGPFMDSLCWRVLLQS
ncbi:protein transport protein SEC31-like isoform X1 [Passer montanus]|uniref:protein transport protein SEC31-like isoform X1 n=1 Tax=Passer montanus TaxID=9160 RepID=UPI0019604F64|nr:protein transport protein SEC31-like isoform X1 [Passer montanus]